MVPFRPLSSSPVERNKIPLHDFVSEISSPEMFYGVH